MSDGDLYPADWRRVTVRDLAERIDGQVAPPDEWKEDSLPRLRFDRAVSLNRASQDSDGSAGSAVAQATGLLPSLRRAASAVPEDDDPGARNEHAFTVVPADGVDLPFLQYFLEYYLADLAARAQAQDPSLSTAHITGDDLLPIQVAIPSAPEQRRIAEILDSLDAAAQRTEMLIGKLEQMRTGLRSQLLVRGLDRFGFLRNPVAHPEHFRDSPLGKIPATWRVLTLEQVCLDIADGPWSTPNYRHDGVLVATSSAIRDGTFESATAPRVSEHEHLYRVSQFEPQPGDIVFTREAPVGEAFVIPDEMRLSLGRRTVALRPDPFIALPGFVVAQLHAHSTRRRLERLTLGSVPVRLDLSQVRSFAIPVPPIEEQKQILGILDAQDDWIRFELAFRRKLDLLREGLMDDLLTGQVRVFDASEPVASTAETERSPAASLS